MEWCCWCERALRPGEYVPVRSEMHAGEWQCADDVACLTRQEAMDYVVDYEPPGMVHAARYREIRTVTLAGELL